MKKKLSYPHRKQILMQRIKIFKKNINNNKSTTFSRITPKKIRKKYVLY